MGTTDLQPPTTDEEITETELDALVQSTLDEVGIALEALREQAAQGRFDSEKFRRAWFVIAGLGRG